ncbi:hypothetical protein AB0H82_10635 [Streptomyces sp. NPDC050732]|uniref:hypothetical protein n=1 Tax=Streptomyces sp. NPDC050732 TaxID=3154632 RepID=UPI003422EADA
MPHPFLGRRALRVLRAAGRLTVLALLLAGVPWVLARAGTLPAGVPSAADISNALLSPDDGQVLFTVMTVLAWALWLWFALGVLAELPYLLLRRRPAHGRQRALGAPQRLAGFLLGGLLVLPAGTAMAAPAPALAATAPVQPTPEGAGGEEAAKDRVPAAAAARQAPRPAPAGPVHVVGETGETVWDLAVDYLGSGARSSEIRTLNAHLPKSALLPAGLHVQLPPDARIPSPAPSPVPEHPSAPAGPSPRMQLAAADEQMAMAEEQQGKRTHTVKVGESLSGIAQEELGDAAQWPKLFEASKGQDQPGTTPPVSNPDLIYPGQLITVPTSPPGASGDKRERPGSHDDGSAGEKDNSGNGEDAGAGSPDPRQPSATPQQPGREQPGPTPSREPLPAAKPAPDADASWTAGAFSLRTAGVLVSLAAAVTLALALRRILQRRRARPGELIAMPQETSTTEAQLAQAAEPAGLLRLDLALRTLAHHSTQQGHSPPALRGARITDSGVHVLPEDLQAAPLAPFTADRGGWWKCENTAELLDQDEAARVPSPYPGLVTIGADEDGHLVLLDLCRTGVLLLDGDLERRTEVLTSLALELGMSPWASDVEIVVVGFGKGLNHLLPTGRIAHIDQPDQAARDFAERLLEAHQEPAASRTPYLILCAVDLGADSAWQVAETFHKAGDTMKVALIAPAGQAHLLFEDSELLDAARTQPQTLDSLGLDVTLQRLEHDALQEVTDALTVSGQEPRPADGPWQHVPSETQTAHAARTAAAGPSARTNPPRTPSTNSPSSAADAPITGTRRTAADSGGLGIYPALLAASASPSAVPDMVSVVSRNPDEPDAPLAPATEDLDTPLPSAAADNEPQAPATERPLPRTVPATSSAPPAPAADSGPSPDSPTGSAPPGVPFIQVMGPVAIAGVAASRHGNREAQLAALLHLRPGRSADTLCAEMDPAHPWAPETLNSRLGGLRRSLGKDEEGLWYVPRRSVKTDPFEISPKICCDWHVFLRTVEAALPHGPAGLPHLEQALSQVRGKPFGAHPLPWSEPLQQEIIMRIVSTAHTVATLRLESGPHHDLTLARRAVATGLEVDDTCELLYRDWFQIETAAGNRSGLIAATSRLDQVNRSLGLSAELDTEILMRQLLDQTGDQM